MKKRILKFVSFVLVSLMLAGIGSFAFADEAGSGINGSNWMSSIRSDVPITAINMPGTHDSATKYVNFSLISKTQDGSIYKS